jgi:hypothetical protein
VKHGENLFSKEVEAEHRQTFVNPSPSLLMAHNAISSECFKNELGKKAKKNLPHRRVQFSGTSVIKFNFRELISSSSQQLAQAAEAENCM